MARKPAQVQKQIDEANAISDAMKAPTPDPATPPNLRSVDTHPDAPKLESETPVVQAPLTASGPPADDATPTPSEADRVAELEKAVATVTQQYKTLQGVYRADLDRMKAKVEDLEDSRQQDSAYIAQLEEAAVSAPNVSDADMADFGERELDIVRRVTAEQLNDPLAKMQEKINEIGTSLNTLVPQIQKLDQAAKTTREHTLASFMAENVGDDWTKQNTDPQFNAWLAEVDPFSNRPRSEMLKEAHQAGEFARVATFFNAFRNNANPTPSGGAPTPIPTPTPNPEPAPRVDPAQFIAPGVTEVGDGASLGTAEPGATYVTDADIERYYSDVRRGVYKDRPEAAAQREKEIHDAIARGNYR